MQQAVIERLRKEVHDLSQHNGEIEQEYLSCRDRQWSSDKKPSNAKHKFKADGNRNAERQSDSLI